jgi:hypothetical protein
MATSSFGWTPPNVAMMVLFVVLAAVVAFAVLELGSWAVGALSARFLGRRVPDRSAFLKEQTERLQKLASNQSVRAKIHPVLGWEYGTGKISDTEHLNSQGIRADREYAPEPTPGITRLAAFGDSYVYCNEVGDADSWPGQLEAKWKCEAINYGVGGYGTDQAFLRFREEGRQMKPHVVIIGFTSMQATRVVSRYRRFQDPGDGPWFKPRFLLNDTGGLEFLASPVASAADAERLVANPAGIVAVGEHDYWYSSAVFEHWLYPKSATYRLIAWTGHAAWLRYIHRDRVFKGELLSPDSEAFELLSRIFRDFVAAVRAAGMKPVVLMLPSRADLNLFVDRQVASYETLRAYLEKTGVSIIDPATTLTANAPLDDLFAPAGHYSPKGNAIVANVIAEALQLPLRAELPSIRHEVSA